MITARQMCSATSVNPASLFRTRRLFQDRRSSLHFIRAECCDWSCGRRDYTLSAASTSASDETDLLPEDKEISTLVVPRKRRKKEPPPPQESGNLKSSGRKQQSLTATAKAILTTIKKQAGLDIDLSSLIPKQYLKQTKYVPTSLYLVDKTVASKFADLIEAEDCDKSCPVVELHPGVGLLTEELVNRLGFQHVTCFQDNNHVKDYLASRLNVNVIDSPTDNLPRIHHLDKHDGGERINTVLSKIKTQVSGDPDSTTPQKKHERLYLIGTAPQLGFINFLIRSYATHRLFYDDDLPWSRVTMFMALGPNPCHICTATPETGMVSYRPSSVFYQTFFKSKDLGTIPRNAFIPWQLEQVPGEGMKKRKMTLPDPTVLRVFKVDVNEENLERIGKENLFAYWYFVRHHLHARSNRIIPELENWIPGCGIRLIKQGFTIYSQFGALQPAEILNLYLQFVSWPEFSNSSFLTAMEKYQTRIELTEEDDQLPRRNTNFEGNRR